MGDFSLAAKGVIMHDNRLLLLQRRLADVQRPGIWELPGGRLKLFEDPVVGVKREIAEETCLEVEVVMPFSSRHFTRDDGQTITMLVFLCKAFGKKVRLSEEHVAFEWVEIGKAKQKISDFFHKEIDLFNKLELGKHV